MSADVIAFTPRPPAEPLVWICGCGCSTHYHRSDGTVACGTCGTTPSELTGEWRLKLPDLPDEPQELDASTFKVTQLDSPAAFLQRHAKSGTAGVVAILILNDDGTFATWAGDMTGPDRSAWLKRQLGKVWDRLTGVKPK